MHTIKGKLISIFILCVLTLIGSVSYLTLNKGSNDSKGTSQSTMGDKLGGDFNLPLADGEFRLEDYRGKVVVLYFGYASCPDVCPTALALLGNALKKMPENVTAQIQPLFISVDPARDKLTALKQYGQYFHPSLLAGTTEQAKIDTLVRQYGAFYSFTTLENSAMGYSVDHSSRLYLINKNGKLADTVSHGDIQQDLAQKLLKLTN